MADMTGYQWSFLSYKIRGYCIFSHIGAEQIFLAFILLHLLLLKGAQVNPSVWEMLSMWGHECAIYSFTSAYW